METVVDSVDPTPPLFMNSLPSIWLETLVATAAQEEKHWMSGCKAVSGAGTAPAAQERSGLLLVFGRNQIFLEETRGAAYLSS